MAATAVLTIGAPAYAQHGHGGGKAATSPSTQHGPSPTATTHGNSGATTHGNSGATTHGNSGATTHGNSSATTHGKSGDTHGSSAKSASTTTSTTTSGSSTTSGSNTTTLTPVQQKLQKNTNLADKLRSRLPEGTDLMKASDGFKNLGQFVAAVNVSNNLGLKFTDVKTRVVDQGMSLGQAIQDAKKLSSANVQTEVQRAETEANEMIKSTTSTSNSTTTTNTASKKKTAKSGTGSTDDK
jgi:cellulose 1,4-beta-cellobiosidase